MYELYLLIGFMCVMHIPFLAFWLFRRQRLQEKDLYFIFSLLWSGVFLQIFSVNHLLSSGTFPGVSTGIPTMIIALMGIRTFFAKKEQNAILRVYRVRVVSWMWALFFLFCAIVGPLFLIYASRDQIPLAVLVFPVLVIICLVFRSSYVFGEAQDNVSFSSHTVGQFAALMMAAVLVNCLLWHETLFHVRLLDVDPHHLLVMFYYTSLFLLFYRSGKREVEVRKHQLSHEEAPAPFIGFDDDMADVVSRVELRLVGDRLFLSPLISLDMLSRETGVSRHQLSKIFSMHYRQSFYQLISALRVQYAMSSIQKNPGELGVERLSEVCGYSSRASFNKHFKAYTGFTPSVYQKKILATKGNSAA